MNKYYKPLTIIVAFLILSLATVASFAYFTASVNGNSNAYDTVITTGEMALMLNDGEQVALNNAIPGNSITKEFSVKNTGTVETTYDVYFSELLNTFEDRNDLVYTLTSSNGCTDGNEKVVPRKSSDDSKMVSACSINPNQIHNYTLTIIFKNDGTNQDDNKGKIINTRISVNKYNVFNSEGYLAKGPDFYTKIWGDIAGDKTNIQRIIRSEVEPTDSDNYIIVNDSESGYRQDYPIYMWYSDGIVYVYTDNLTVFLNRNSEVMFAGLTQVQEIDLSMFDTLRVTDMQQMFYDDKAIVSLDLSDFDTRGVVNMEGLFSNCEKLKKLDLSSFQTYSLSRIGGMFNNNIALEDLNFGNDFNVSRVTSATSIANLFTSLNSLKKIKFGNNFNINVNSIYGLLNNKANLEEVEFGYNFITPNVKDISYLFHYDEKLTRIINLNRVNVSSVENMAGLFKNCGALNYLDLSSFNTSNVTNMQYMFMNCGSLQTLDLSAFDMSKVTKADSMFNNDKNLRTIYTTADWSLANGASSGGMFVYCDNLVGGSGTSYAIQYNDAVYARIDDPNHGKPGYFTLKTN